MCPNVVSTRTTLAPKASIGRSRYHRSAARHEDHARQGGTGAIGRAGEADAAGRSRHDAFEIVLPRDRDRDRDRPVLLRTRGVGAFVLPVNRALGKSARRQERCHPLAERDDVARIAHRQPVAEIPHGLCARGKVESTVWVVESNVLATPGAAAKEFAIAGEPALAARDHGGPPGPAQWTPTVRALGDRSVGCNHDGRSVPR